MESRPTKHAYTPAHNQRLERHLYQELNRPVFFTIRAYEHSRPFERLDLAQAVIVCLMEERNKAGCGVYAYSVLPDHAHIVAFPAIEGGDTLRFMDRFKGKSTRISWAYGVKGKLWQPRSYDHILRAEESLIDVAEYTLFNSVRLGLADRWEDYPLCGLADPMPVG